jgi:uncharacterized Zn-finger protein
LQKACLSWAAGCCATHGDQRSLPGGDPSTILWCNSPKQPRQHLANIHLTCRRRGCFSAVSCLTAFALACRAICERLSANCELVFRSTSYEGPQFILAGETVRRKVRPCNCPLTSCPLPAPIIYLELGKTMATGGWAAAGWFP